MNQKTLEQLKLLYKSSLEIAQQLLEIDIKKERDKYTNLKKKQSRLEPIVKQYLNYIKIDQEIKEAKEMLNQKEYEELFEKLKTEIKSNENKLNEAATLLKLTLIPKDPNDDKNVIIEIRGAVGGDEANIFAGDLYRMYIKYCEIQN